MESATRGEHVEQVRHLVDGLWSDDRHPDLLAPPSVGAYVREAGDPDLNDLRSRQPRVHEGAYRRTVPRRSRLRTPGHRDARPGLAVPTT